jgi:hypothetical protein
VSPVYVRLGGGTEVPSIGLRKLEKAGSEGDGDEYWRMTEFEEEEAEKYERKERVGVSGWRKRKWRGGLMSGVERGSGCPEVIWREGKSKGRLGRSFKWLRDLVLRVPKLEGCDV